MAVLTPTFTNNTNIIPDFASPDFILGYEMVVTTDSQLTLSSGNARSYNNNFEISYLSNVPFQPAALTVDKSVLGANGCWPIAIDVAAAGVDTLFPVYVQGIQSGQKENLDGTSTSSGKSVATIVTGNNFQLPNFSSWRRIGSIYYDASADELIPMVQTGRHNVRQYTLQNSIPLVTASAAVVLTKIDLDAAGLPIDVNVVTEVYLKVRFTGAAPADFVGLTPFATASTAYPVQVSATVAAVQNVANVRMSIGKDSAGSPSIWFINSAAAGATTIELAGWVEDYGVNAV